LAILRHIRPARDASLAEALLERDLQQPGGIERDLATAIEPPRQEANDAHG
jgi:hypothetical protein